MKHVLLYAGLGLLGYCLIKQHQATNNVAVANDPQSAYNGGVANTSGGGNNITGGSAATNIGGLTGTVSTIPTPVTRDSPSALAFFGGGNAAHPLDF